MARQWGRVQGQRDGWRVSREEAGRRRQFGEKRGGTVTHVRLHADTLDFYYL